jgi:hypothetical protein
VVSGSFSGVISGVEYVAKEWSFGDVVNMSLGGPFSEGLNDAVISAAGKASSLFVLLPEIQVQMSIMKVLSVPMELMFTRSLPCHKVTTGPI